MSKADFRGAESKLFYKKWLEYPALYKIRIPKKYRIKELDFHFRKQRTIYEARLLAKAKDAGVRVPIIYEIDIENTTIVMEYIKGEILKTLLPKLDNKYRDDYCTQIGINIGKLHCKNIIHGDLTTSNIIKLEKENQIAFIDFGLGYISDRIEDFGIDMYLLERALQNTHPNLFQKAWKAVIEGYKTTSPHSEVIESKILEIASRGRYSERV